MDSIYEIILDVDEDIISMIYGRKRAETRN